MVVDVFHKVLERCDEIRKLRYSNFKPMQGTEKLLQVFIGWRKFHIIKTTQESRVVHYTILRNHLAESSDILCKKDKVSRMQLNVKLNAKLELILHIGQNTGDGFVLEKDIIQLYGYFPVKRQIVPRKTPILNS